MSNPADVVAAFIGAVEALDVDAAVEVTDEGLISLWRDYLDMTTYLSQLSAPTGDASSP